MKRIIVGSRDSALAVAQTRLVMEELKRAHPSLELELVTLKTTGDKILDKELYHIGGKGLFVKELDRALLDGRIDLAVHSMKDMPMEENPRLPLAAVLKRGDPRDVLVLPKGERETVYDKIGTSSQRRKLQFSAMEPKADYTLVRGNIHTRLKKLDEGQCSALILAAAGLERAGLEGRISRYFAVDQMIPAACQGILAIQTREDFDQGILEKIHHQDTWRMAQGERSFVRQLGGGCSSPIGAYGRIWGDEMELIGFYYDEEKGRSLRGSIRGEKSQSARLGQALAERLLRG